MLFSSFVCHFSRTLFPYQFLENRNEPSCMQFSKLKSWERAPAWIPFSESLQWLSSVTLYLKNYPFCCNWWNFILFNGWVIILLKIYKHAFLQIKYPCFTRDLGAPRLSFLCLLVDSSPQVLFYKDHDSTSCKKMCWMKCKMGSRFPGEISIASYVQMMAPLWQKVKKN